MLRPRDGHVCYTRHDMETKTKEMVIRGYHIYKSIWDAVVGEILECRREKHNKKDRYAVAVFQNNRIVGHLPKKYSRLCSLFLDKGGLISCTVAGRRHFSFDLIQGGLEIPCLVTFTSTKKNIKKISKFL